MAITWNVTISNVNVDTKRADVTATRTDDSTDPDTVDTYSFKNTPIETSSQRLIVLNSIKAAVEADASLDTSVSTLISDMETSAKTNLEDWEATR